jgi:hypothetical protein
LIYSFYLDLFKAFSGLPATRAGNCAGSIFI